MTVWIKTENGWAKHVSSFFPCSNSNDIQGCHKSEPLDVIQIQMRSRITRFLRANSIGNMLEKQHHFSGDSFNEPLHGAFGEKL